MHRTLFVAAIAFLPATPGLRAQTFEIIPFTYQQSLGGAQGSRVEGIARDGSVIVGAVCRFGDIGCGARRPVFWTQSLEMLNLPFSAGGVDEFVLAASDSAGVVAAGSTTGLVGARWLGGPGGTIDPFLGPPEFTGGTARDVSADGVVVIGDTAIYDEEFFAYARGVVRVGDGPVELLSPADGYIHSRANALNADGGIVVGSSYSEPDATGFGAETACIWPLTTRVPLALPPYTAVPGASTFALDISSDGSVVVGSAFYRDEAIGTLRYLAVRWVRTGSGWSGPVDLLPGGGCVSCLATRVSGDGRVIIGEHDRAGVFLWREGMPPVDLAEMLVASGVDIDSWTFPEATGVSDDGRTVVGNVFKRVCECPFCDCLLFNAGFRVMLGDGPACAADFNHDGVLGSGDFFDFLGAFFRGELTADFNADDLVNSQDFFDYLLAFVAGC
jgi:uncharacterized membrane protein